MSASAPADFSASVRAPQRMSLTNVSTTDSIEAEFNPEELEEAIAVNYARLAVLGLSHEPLQYQRTGNHGFDFDLALRAYDESGNRVADIQYHRRFLLSLCYPRRGAGNVVGGAPPRVLFVWPNLASLTAVITSLKMKHTLFGRDGTPYHSAIKVGIEEIRDFRLFSEDVLKMGTQRSGTTNPA